MAITKQVIRPSETKLFGPIDSKIAGNGKLNLKNCIWFKKCVERESEIEREGIHWNESYGQLKVVNHSIILLPLTSTYMKMVLWTFFDMIQWKLHKQKTLWLLGNNWPSQQSPGKWMWWKRRRRQRGLPQNNNNFEPMLLTETICPNHCIHIHFKWFIHSWKQWIEEGEKTKVKVLLAFCHKVL